MGCGTSSSALQTTSDSQTQQGCPVEDMQSGDGRVDSLPSSHAQGNILHCFDWSFAGIEAHLDEIADAGFRVVQTSPVQQPKASGSAWYFLYQPCSFSVATSSPLGGASELASLCAAAESKGISVIVDVVANHMATTGAKDSEGFMVIDPEVATYEPEIYADQHRFFHRVASPTGAGTDTQTYPGLPDLNTGDAFIQDKVYGLLKQCIDLGVDGFRFDAAKHIETANDPEVGSSFWENTLVKANAYYKQKTGVDLIAYGEILGGLASGRNLEDYTSIMKVTDDSYINSGVKIGAMGAKDAKRIAEAPYGKNVDPSKLILWVESHDTYESETNHNRNSRIAKLWSVIGSRKDAQGLYLSRPVDPVGQVGETFFTDPSVSSVNAFANRFAGADEYLHAQDADYFINERYSSSDAGAIVMDVAEVGPATIAFEHLPDGYYFDRITDKQVHIQNGKGCIDFGEAGFAVLTRSRVLPKPVLSISQAGGLYFAPFDLTIEITNAVTASYSLDGAAPVAFDGKATIRIGEGKSSGAQTTLGIIYSNGAASYTKSYVFTMGTLLEGGFNIVNFKADYVSDYEIRIWSWAAGKEGSYSASYEYHEDSSILLITDVADKVGFLVALFNKGSAPDVGYSTWVTPAKQTPDIATSSAYYDASSF